MPAHADQVLRLSRRVTLLPILHANGDMAQEVRDYLISRRVDCVAVPLPPTVEAAADTGVARLPIISVVTLPEPDQDGEPLASFVPIDPCQAVIMAIRVARLEGIPCAYIDREVSVFEPAPFAAPDPYALKRVSLPAYAAAVVPALPRPAPDTQRQARIDWMAFRLHALEVEYQSIVCLCHLADWPWLREAYRKRHPVQPPERPAGFPSCHRVDPDTLYFALGELPFLTELYERRRSEARSDRHLSVDGLKELLLEARGRWQVAHELEIHTVRNWVTPHLLSAYLQYVRNLALMDRRLTPDLYTLITAAKQMAGDDFAITLLETARSYAFQPAAEDPYAGVAISVGIDRLELPDGRVARAKNRLQGPALLWRTLALRPAPPKQASRQWAMQWDPLRQCSWPPEDRRIERFTLHVRQQARALLGADLARVEKFTTSVKDGIDLRETLRHRAEGLARLGRLRLAQAPSPSRGARPSTFRQAQGPEPRRGGASGSNDRGRTTPGPVPPLQSPPGTVLTPVAPEGATDALKGASPTRMDLYVKEAPPTRGHIEIVVFLFDTPADPAEYAWQATWYAEHEEESTLSFYATPFRTTMVGPGIGQATYGGALFLFPPRPIPDLWADPALRFATTLEERLIAGAARHSRAPHIALVSPIVPTAAWRRIARRAQRRLIHIPLNRFSGQTVDRLRHFHVLNGHEIRSYAARFIRA